MLQKIIELTNTLIRFKTTEDSPSLVEAIDYIENYLREYPLVIKSYFRQGKPSLVITFRESKEIDFFLNGHLDVVDAKANDFEPRLEEGGKLYGRGSSDMKGPLAAMIVLMMDLSQLEPNKRPDIGLMIVSDEEIGGEAGTYYLLNEEGYRSKACLIPDGGNNFDIIIKEKGILELKIFTEGKSAHGSKPWLGVNAIEELIKKYQLIKEFFGDVNAGEWKTTCNLGRINGGGEAINRVPDYAEAWLDIRFTLTGEDKNIIKKIKEIMDGNVRVDIIGNLLNTSKDNVYVQNFKNIAEEILQREIKITHESGASDGRYFTELGIPTFLFKPNGANIHGDNEYIEIDALGKFYQILKRFILENVNKIPIVTKKSGEKKEIDTDNTD